MEYFWLKQDKRYVESRIFTDSPEPIEEAILRWSMHIKLRIATWFL